MALQTSVAVRITIRGDGISQKMVLDLRTTLVQYVNASYCVLPVLPQSIITASIAGPNLSPEAQLPEVVAKLDGPILSMMFNQKLMDNKDHYTVDLILGYDSIPEPEPPKINGNMTGVV